MFKETGRKSFARLLFGVLLAFPPPLAWSQTADKNDNVPVFGTISFGAVDDAPAVIQLPPMLVELAKVLVERTSKTGNEHGTCIQMRRRETNWTIDEITEGTKFTIALDCYRSLGRIHSHPDEIGTDPLPSSADLSVFIVENGHISIAVHRTGICALVSGSPTRHLNNIYGESPVSRNLKSFRYYLSSAAYIDSQEKLEAAVGGTAARAARDYGFPLYCGPRSGKLSKIAAGTYKTDITDALTAKALVIMLKVSKHPDWDKIDFKFTPEIDEDFVRYVNKVLLKMGENDTEKQPIAERAPDKFVDILFNRLAYDEALGFSGFMTLPADLHEPRPAQYLAFGCASQVKSPEKTRCSIRSEVKSDGPQPSGRNSRFFARYFEGGDHQIIEYPELKNNEYRNNDLDVPGIGYLDEGTSLYIGPFRDGQRHGEGDLLIKESGKKYRATFSQGKLLAAKPVP